MGVLVTVRSRTVVDGESDVAVDVQAFIEMVERRGEAWVADMLARALDVRADLAESDRECAAWDRLRDEVEGVARRIENASTGAS